MKWSIVIVMLSLLAITFWGHGGFDGLTLDIAINRIMEVLEWLRN